MNRAIAYFEVLQAMLDCIEARGRRGLPSGELYAMVMGAMSLETYERIIAIFKAAGKVYEEHNVLYKR